MATICKWFSLGEGFPLGGSSRAAGDEGLFSQKIHKFKEEK